MRQSIGKIFTNLNIYLLIILLIAIISTLLVLEQTISNEKIDILKNQKVVIAKLMKLDKSSMNTSIIEFNSQSRKLISDINILKKSYAYNITGQYLIDNETEYMNDLTQLNTLVTKFNKSARNYYTDQAQNKEEQFYNLYATYDDMSQHINNMIFKNISYDRKKFNTIKNATLITLLFIFISTFWYRQRINAIYKDIRFLYRIEKDNKKSSYDIFSQEADAIYLRMKRKSVTLDNPEVLDPVTDIYNYKGLLNTYNNRKNNNDKNFISVAILEIDSFSKTNRAFTQEMTQAMLKKVAFTISLHQQQTDIIARTDYNQFTLILSRINKKQSYIDLDILRQSISEIEFNTPTKGKVNITVSCGFTIKPSSLTLDNAILKAKEVLAHAKSKGGNRVSQTQDLIILEDKNVPEA